MEEEDDTYCRFGTPLEPLDEDEVPSKKPIAIEDQIVTDANGKRRFHGAFTGGFSAGFWNTVGSLEGWKPQSFKSSRAEKAEKQRQRVIDFMDEEDLGEFGIAPQRIQTTEDFTRQEDKPSSSAEKIRKRKLQQTAGPIPGVPVLHQLLQPAKDNIAIRLLKKMGWKEGQGVGARQTRKEKKLAAQRNARERYIMKKYGCDMGPMQQEAENDDGNEDENESDISDDDITFAPDDFEPFVCNIKINTFGLGYQGLSRDPVLKKQQHINLFGDAFEVVGKDNKKLSIRGQAFGVGALEEDDEDIYARDDMARYDFTLGGDSAKKKKENKTAKTELGVIEGFAPAQHVTMYTKKIFTITLPESFKPRNWAVRRSRFEPLDEDRALMLRKQDEHKVKGLGRHDLDPDQRGQILGESSSGAYKATENSNKDVPEPEPTKKKTYLERINEKYKSKEAAAGSDSFLAKLAAAADKFTKKEILNDDGSTSKLEEETRKENEKVLAKAENVTKNLDKTPGVFKPFAGNQSKQERYEKFLEANPPKGDETLKFLATIQPLSMTDWEREFEMKEFIQAKNIYQPLKGFMSDRFVSETEIVTERKEVTQSKQADKVIKIVRTKTMWKPSSNLCKRFNIAEPFGGTMIDEKKEKKKSKFSVFDYLEVSVNKKEDFVTPVIIPTKVEKPKPIISHAEKEKEAYLKTQESESSNSRLSTKESFTSEIKTSKIEWDKVTDTKKTTAASSSRTKQRQGTDKNKTELEKKVEAMKNKHPSEKKDLFKAIFDTDSEGEDDQVGVEKKEQTPAETLDVAKILGIEAHKDIFAATKQSAAEINVLRNTSPPRGIFANLFAKKKVDPEPPKEVSLAAEVNKISEINKTAEIAKSESVSIASTSNAQKEDKSNSNVSKITFKPRSERRPQPDPEDTYGPRIPVNFSTTVSTPNSAMNQVETKKSSDADEMDEKLLKLLKQSKKEAKIVEQWVEKSSSDSKKKKKKDKDKDVDKKKKSKKHKKDKKKHKDKK